MNKDKERKQFNIEVGQRIASRRNELNLTQLELAKKIGYSSKSTINKIELGINGLKQDKIPTMAKALETTIGYIMGDHEHSSQPQPFTIPDTISNLVPLPETRTMPTLGGIACGEPIYCDQEYTSISGPIRADFCLRAEGESMINANIKDGDLVFCVSQEQVNNGEIAACIINDSATLKRYYRYGSTIALRPENPNYPEQIYEGEEANNVRVIGKAIALQTLLK